MDARLETIRDQFSTPVYMTGRAEIVEYYQDKYGAKDWRSHIIADFQAQGDTRKRGSIAREFQVGSSGKERYKSAAKGAAKERYEKLGKTLDPIGRTPKQDSIKFVVTGKQKSSHPGGRERDRELGTGKQDIKISGQDLQDWIDNPSWDELYDAYGWDFDVDGDGDYSLYDVAVSAS